MADQFSGGALVEHRLWLFINKGYGGGKGRLSTSKLNKSGRL